MQSLESRLPLLPITLQGEQQQAVNVCRLHQVLGEPGDPETWLKPFLDDNHLFPDEDYLLVTTQLPEGEERRYYLPVDWVEILLQNETTEIAKEVLKYLDGKPEKSIEELLPTYDVEISGKTRVMFNAQDLYAYVEAERVMEYSDWVQDALLSHRLEPRADFKSTPSPDIDYFFSIPVAMTLVLIEAPEEKAEAFRKYLNTLV